MPAVRYFPYFGPGRRSGKTVVEVTLYAAPDDRQYSLEFLSNIKALLQATGILTVDERFPEQELASEPLARYAALLVQTALLFQRKAGHRVDFCMVSHLPGEDHCFALVEYEHCDVGMTAVKLADELLIGKLKSLTEPFQVFLRFAKERLLSQETEAIIKAARQRDIPCFQIDRFPFAGFKNRSDRVRRNGLLMLGHGVNHRILDGTFCLDKSGDRLKALLRSPSQRRAVLKKLGCSLEVTQKRNIASEEAIDVFVVNGQVTAVVGSSAAGHRVIENLHASMLDLCIAISAAAEGFPVVVSLLTVDAGKSLAQSGGRVVGFELGPDLERLTGWETGAGSQLLETTVSALLDWLFGAQFNARIPVIAVTGTNGKTTTTRMIGHVMTTAGRQPGMVTTDGMFLNGKQISETDAGSFIGHAKLLTSKTADVAVLESHHKGMLVRGFAFEWCDVAVCLNVTVDHLDDVNIRSVEEMAVLKRSLMERARYGAVLNADNRHSLDMLDHLVAEKTCLVSMQSKVKDLQVCRSKSQLCFCLLEVVDDHDWIVIYDQARLPVMPVVSIPASFSGHARFNVSNAMHAIAASYLAGIDLQLIRAGMESFGMSFENTPGRLNFYDRHPFRVLMDFAHNTDGMRQLCEFVEHLDVSGRKFLMFQVKDKKEEKYVRSIVAAAAGHFDHYVCRTHPLFPGEDKNRAPAMLRAALLESGVDENQITVIADPALAVDGMLKMGAAGDLLVFTPGQGQARLDAWNQIISFKSDIEKAE